jgi:hypothetical protein
MDLVDIYRIFYPTAKEYTFFSAAHETLYKTDILDIKQVLTSTRKLK